MERHTLVSGCLVGNVEYLPGDPATFDGITVTIRQTPHLGFKDKDGNLWAYTDDTCSNSVRLDVTLDPASLVGATILKVTGMREGSEAVVIRTGKGALTMHHVQECCEYVCLLDVVGDSDDLVGGTIAVFEVRSGRRDGSPAKPYRRGRAPHTNRLEWRTYTFYEIRTTRGDVTLRWGEPDFNNDNHYGEGITLTLSDEDRTRG